MKVLYFYIHFLASSQLYLLGKICIKRGGIDGTMFLHFDMNTALFMEIHKIDCSSLVSRVQYRPRTTDNDFTIRIFCHFLPPSQKTKTIKLCSKSFDKCINSH